jgi:hypothetical protein
MREWRIASWKDPTRNDTGLDTRIHHLVRHFEDLRDGTHGGPEGRKDKEIHFEKMNTTLLLGTGQLTESGLRRTPDGGLNAFWALSWLNTGPQGSSQSSSRLTSEADSTTRIFAARRSATGL